MPKFDLHTHTTKSDGELSPTALVKLAKKQGLTYLAITDHHTQAGIAEAKTASKKYGVKIITGCEIQVVDYYKNKKVENHLLAFNMDAKKIDPALKKFCQKFEKAFIDMTIAACKSSQKNPIILSNNILIKPTFAKLNNFAPTNKVAGPGEIWAYTAKQINQLYNKTNKTKNRTIIGLYQAYAIFKKGDQKYIKQYKNKLTPYVKSPIDKMNWYVSEDFRPFLSLQDAFKYIKKADGLIVIAHPGEDGQMTGAKNFAAKMKADEEYLKHLKKQGLDGLEVYAAKHTPRQIKAYLRIAKKLDLLISGGTDFHGTTYSPEKELGCMTQKGVTPKVFLPFGEVEGLLDRLVG